MAKNKRLTNKRNLKLIERYFHYTEIKRRRFDDVLEILKEEEFFIEKNTIENILKEDCYNDILNTMIEDHRKKTKNQTKLLI